MADWLRFHSLIARRRYTGSSAPADSADCRFGDMARGREGGEGREGGRERGGREREGRGGGGEGRGGRGGEGRGGEGTVHTFHKPEPFSRPPAKRVTG